MIETMLFDFDGTIVNTNELIIDSFLHVLEGQTSEPLTRENIIPHMGKSLTEQFVIFSGKTEVDEMIRAYREFNLRMHDELIREFPYVKEVLERLHLSGIRLGVVTNKVRLTTEKGLAFYGLDKYMDVVVTADEVKSAKPDPEGILLAVSRLGCDPERTLMVGDSQFDLQAAQNAGVLSAGVAWSLKGEKFLNQFRPDYMLHDMRDLYEIAGLTRDGK
jgi:pyrophosphatase PpaX